MRDLPDHGRAPGPTGVVIPACAHQSKVLWSVAMDATDTLRRARCVDAAAARIADQMRQVSLRAASAALMTATGLVATSGASMGHHSLVMYDREHPIELVGTVREFKFVSPHTRIVLEVPGKDAQ